MREPGNPRASSAPAARSIFIRHFIRQFMYMNESGDASRSYPGNGAGDWRPITPVLVTTNRHFTPSEVMLYKHAATTRMTESELRGLVRLLNHPDFDSFDISSEMGDRHHWQAAVDHQRICDGELYVVALNHAR